MKYYKLKEICDIIKGKTPIKKSIPGDFPLVVTAEERLTNNDYQFDTQAVCIPLVSSTGHGKASLNRIHYQEGKFALGNILCALIVKEPELVLTKYLYIYLSIYKDDVIVPLMSGSANVSLSISKLYPVEIPIPDIKKQKKIIEKYDSYMQYIEEINKKLMENKNNVLNLKKRLYQELVKSPSSNTISSIKEICTIKTGKKDANYGSTNGKYNFYTCAMEPLKCDDYSFSGESIILPGNGANVGLSIYYNGDFEAYQRTYVLQKNSSLIDMKYLYYHMLGNWFDYNIDKQFGSATPYIKLGNVQDYPISLPSIQIQKQIVQNISNTEKKIELVEKLINDNIIISENLTKRFFQEILQN